MQRFEHALVIVIQTAEYDIIIKPTDYNPYSYSSDLRPETVSERIRLIYGQHVAVWELSRGIQLN
jgi:hypothetical protein